MNIEERGPFKKTIYRAVKIGIKLLKKKKGKKKETHLGRVANKRQAPKGFAVDINCRIDIVVFPRMAESLIAAVARD